MKIIIQWFEIKSLPYMSSNNSRYLRMVQIWYPFVYFDQIWPSTVYWQFIKLEFHLSVHSSICLERHLLIVRLTSQIKGNDDQTEPMIHFFNTLSPRQNYYDSTDHIFQLIFFRFSSWNIFNGPINNEQVMVRMMAWCWWNREALFGPMVAQADTCMHHLGPLLLTWFDFNPSMDKQLYLL